LLHVLLFVLPLKLFGNFFHKFIGMPRPPFMHGFILGNTTGISYDAQVMIENILSIDTEM
jgi:hypothetical protein